MASLRRKVGLTVGFISLFGVAGCKQILGLTERGDSFDAGLTEAGVAPPVTVIGQCGSLAHPSTTCAECMDRNCCTEASACQVDSSCNTAFDCLARCADDGACRARCAQFYNRDD